MVRDNRVKFYYFTGSPALMGTSTSGDIDTYSDSPINGRIQSIYFEGGQWNPAGSLMISVSGTGGGLTSTEGGILTMTSGTDTGHHLGEDWVVFPRATSVTTTSLPVSGVGTYGICENEIPVYSILRVQAGSNIAGAGSMASGLTVVYI